MVTCSPAGTATRLPRAIGIIPRRASTFKTRVVLPGGPKNGGEGGSIGAPIESGGAGLTTIGVCARACSEKRKCPKHRARIPPTATTRRVTKSGESGATFMGIRDGCRLSSDALAVYKTRRKEIVNTRETPHPLDSEVTRPAAAATPPRRSPSRQGSAPFPASNRPPRRRPRSWSFC